MRARDITLDAISEDSTQPFTVSSPRSVEALARQGILVQELQYRSVEDFREAVVPEEVAQMRFEHYEMRRRERIKQAQHEYRTVCSTPAHSAHSRGPAAEFSGPVGSTLDESGAQEKELQAMRKQLEAMKNKQREEVVDQLMKDFRNQKMAEIREQKEAAARAREEALMREKMLRAKEWEALKLEREERKKEEERQAEIERRKLAEAHFKQEKTAARKAEMAEKQRRIEAEKREEERMQRAEELKKQTEAIFAEQQRLADERKRQMEERDRVRQIAREKQNQELLMENKRKREETEARMAAVVEAQNEAKRQQELEMEEKHRISEAKRLAFEAKRNEELAAAKRASDAKALHIRATIEQNDRREEAKKDLYRRKEAEAMERLRVLAIEKQHDDARKQQERDDKERARQAAIEKARADEEARKMSLLAKFEADSHKMDRVNAQRNRDTMIKNEQDRLRKQDKVDAVERLKRVEAFNREKQLQKIEEDNRRLAEMNHRKYLLQQEKIQVRKEQEVMMKSLMAAVERFEKTKVWQAPPGLDFELDIHHIKRQAEAQVTRSREPSQSSVSRISVSGGVAGGGGGKQASAQKPLMETPIKKKRAPLSARGRLQEDQGTGEPVLMRPPQASGRPSLEHEQSRSHEQEVSEDTSAVFSADAQEGAASDDAAEDREGRSADDGGERRQDHFEYEELVDVRQARQQPAKDMLFAPASRKALNVQQRRGRSAPNRAKPVPAWHPQHGDLLAPRSHTSGGIQASSKTADTAYRPAKKSKKKAPSQGPVVPSRHAAMQILDGLRRQQNEQLLAVLEEEQAKEAEREVRMADVYQQKDKARLEKIFSQERAEASLRIIDLTARHEKMLAQTMIQLGLS